MSIKVLPVWAYKFTHSQNQYFKIDADNKIKMIDFIELDNTGYTSESDYFASSHCKVFNSVDVGGLKSVFDLSLHDMQDDYMVYAEAKGYTALDINFFIFLDTITSKKYYYFVDNVTRINSMLYRYELSLDVVKTYFNELMGIKNVEPTRFFEKIDDYINPNAYTNFNSEDLLLAKPSQASLKIPLADFVYNLKYNITTQGDNFHYTGLWSYFYISFASDETFTMPIVSNMSFKNENYYIIAYPKNINSGDSIYSKKTFSTKVYNALRRHPRLLKVVDSTIPPFNINDSYSNLIKSFMCRNIVGGTKVELEFTFTDGEYPFFNFFNTNTALKLFASCVKSEGVWSANLPPSLMSALSLNGDSIDDLIYLPIITDNYPINKLNVLNPKTSNIDSISDLDSRCNDNLFISIATLKNEVKTKGESSSNLQKEYNLMFSECEIGFANNQKMLISKNRLYRVLDGSSINKLVYRFKNRIIHSLGETVEAIIYDIASSTQGAEDVEIFIKRANELRATKISDNYSDYVYLNQNALAQKEEQFKYQDKKNLEGTIISGVTTGLGVALSLTGVGASVGLPLAIGGAVSLGNTGYNYVKNKSDIEMNKRVYEAQLEDRKLTPLSFNPSNFNERQEDDYYLPHLVAYRFSSITSNDYTQFRILGLGDGEINKTIAKFGYNTPKTIKSKYEDLFTREKYNFIQLKNTDILESTKPIPNSHFILLKSILEGGISWRAYNFSFGNSNKERS